MRAWSAAKSSVWRKRKTRPPVWSPTRELLLRRRPGEQHVGVPGPAGADDHPPLATAERRVVDHIPARPGAR
jgi:hypothetical protein